MTVYKPLRLFVAGVLAVMAATAALNPFVTDGWLTLFAVVGFWAVIVGVVVCLLWTDGEPQPVSSQLRTTGHVRVIDATSRETVGSRR